MSFTSLPFFDSTNWTMEVALDDIIFTFVFRYNTRSDQWVFDLLTEDEEPLFLGKRLVLNQLFFTRWRTEAMPEGELVAVCPRDVCRSDPERDGFTDDTPLQLIYRSVEASE